MLSSNQVTNGVGSKSLPECLESNTIQLLAQESEQPLIVQLINIKKMKTTNRLSCELSDGHYKIRAYITDERFNQNHNWCFVRIDNYGMLSQNDKIVGIVVHACQILDCYDGLYGDPVDFIKDKDKLKIGKTIQIPIQRQKLRSNAPKQQPRQPLTTPKKTLTQNTHPNMPTSSTQVPIMFPSPLPPTINPATMNQSTPSGPIIRSSYSQAPIISQQTKVFEEATTQQLGKAYDKISDLYADMINWKILVRLVKKNYREFVSNKGKLTKVLNVELVDMAEMRITGALFGDTAKQVCDTLKQDTIYEVSKGTIRQDQYYSNKGKNYSRYTILLSRTSQFHPCQNIPLLPHSKSNLRQLSYISENRKIGEQYDTVGILLSIFQQVQIPKEKTLYKQTLEICDPENQLVMEAVIWNRHVKIDNSMEGKTVMLFGWRLNQYNQKLSLNSSYQSEIRLVQDHQYRKFEGKVDRDKMGMLSEKKDKSVMEVEQPCKNLRELENQIIHLQAGREIKSTLTLTLTFISYKNWSYEGCPHCRRSAEANTRCGNCQKYIEETIPRYKLNVEFSDYCGSIWATGFEQLGQKLFWDVQEGIKGIKGLQQTERHRLFEKKQFQEFTLKLNTKHDREGGIKHTINRIYDCNVLSRINENIKRIKNHQ